MTRAVCAALTSLPAASPFLVVTLIWGTVTLPISSVVYAAFAIFLVVTSRMSVCAP